MSVEIFETANGWVVRPSNWGTDPMSMDTRNSTYVFNTFEGLTEHLRSISQILKRDKTPEKPEKSCDA